MSQFELTMKGTLRAQNFEAAQAKRDEVVKELERRGVEGCEIRLKGEDKR